MDIESARSLIRKAEDQIKEIINNLGDETGLIFHDIDADFIISTSVGERHGKYVINRINLQFDL